MFMFANPSEQEIKQLLESAKRIAVVGLSNNPDRDSYGVAHALQKAGYEIIPVNPTIDEVLGVKAVASLSDIDGPVDIVDVFRRPDQVMPIAKEAVDIKARAIWFQLGVVNEEAAEYAKNNGLIVVMNRCIKVDHARLIGNRN
jgi:hypothetical protein